MVLTPTRGRPRGDRFRQQHRDVRAAPVTAGQDRHHHAAQPRGWQARGLVLTAEGPVPDGPAPATRSSGAEEGGRALDDRAGSRTRNKTRNRSQELKGQVKEATGRAVDDPADDWLHSVLQLGSGLVGIYAGWLAAGPAPARAMTWAVGVLYLALGVYGCSGPACSWGRRSPSRSASPRTSSTSSSACPPWRSWSWTGLLGPAAALGHPPVDLERPGEGRSSGWRIPASPRSITAITSSR
jgi:hypothetical protein